MVHWLLPCWECKGRGDAIKLTPLCRNGAGSCSTQQEGISKEYGHSTHIISVKSVNMLYKYAICTYLQVTETLIHYQLSPTMDLDVHTTRYTKLPSASSSGLALVPTHTQQIPAPVSPVTAIVTCSISLLTPKYILCTFIIWLSWMVSKKVISNFQQVFDPLQPNIIPCASLWSSAVETNVWVYVGECPLP